MTINRAFLLDFLPTKDIDSAHTLFGRNRDSIDDEFDRNGSVCPSRHRRLYRP